MPKNQKSQNDRTVAAGIGRLRLVNVETNAALGKSRHERRIGGDEALRCDRAE